MRIANRYYVVGLLLALALVAGTTWAFAHGGDPDLIHACVNNNSGEIKIVGPDESCKNNQYPLDWNIEGSTGPPGPPGGPPGPPGLSGYEQVTNQTTIPGNLGSGSVFSVVAQCPGGKKVLGGGIRLSGQVSVLADLRVFESQPSSLTAWRAAAIYVGPVGQSSPPAGSVTLKAFAVCAFAN